MNTYERDCVLVWDEMSIKSLLLFDKNLDQFEGIVNHGGNRRSLDIASEVLVVLLRGMNTNWIFPLSYYFSKGPTTTQELDILLSEVLKNLQRTGLNVRVGVCDQGFTNRGLFRRWNVTEQKPFIILGDNIIYMIHDICHIIKLMRNHIKKHGFFVHGLQDDAPQPDNVPQPSSDEVGGEYASWKYLVQFYEIDSSSENRLAPRLQKYHLEVPDLAKMKVKLATQLLSHSVFAGIKTLVELKKMPAEAMGTANFAKVCNDMFDFLNISQQHDPQNTLKSGANVFRNMHMLEWFQEWASRLEMTDGAPLPDCVRGLKLTLSGTSMIIKDLQSRRYKYVLTRRLQQDVIEHFFGTQRSSSGCSKNPTARQFSQNFRFLFVKSLLKCGGGNGNCEIVEENTLLLNSMKRMESFLNSEIGNNLMPSNNSGDQNQAFEDRSDNEFEELCDDNNDPDRSDYQINDFFNLLSRSDIAIKDYNVATYLGNWAVKYIIRTKKCTQCIRMLEFSCDRNPPFFSPEEKLLSNKAYNENLLENHQEQGFGHVLKECHRNVFDLVISEFRPAVIESLNSAGTNVSVNVFNYLKHNFEIGEWLSSYDSTNCKKHREDIIKLVVRSKLYLLVKEKNQQVVSSKAMSQTRRELRHQ